MRMERRAIDSLIWVNLFFHKPIETLRFKTATWDDAAETNCFERMNAWAEILSHIINCMDLEQFEEFETNFICEISFLTRLENARRSISCMRKNI